MITHGSLFSGIGGFDLAADWCGWENKFHCEWNPFGQKVLKHYWPNSTTYEDITKTDFTIWKGRITVLSGGFPCQPYSSAGKRLGKEDERHLWPEMLRAIREISPSYVVGENVLGLTNWNGGLVFEEVCADLEAEGYEVQPFILPAASVNAPHRRDRVWFIAHSNGSNDGRASQQDASEKGKERVQERHAIRKPIESGKVFRSVTDSTSKRDTPPGARREVKTNRRERFTRTRKRRFRRERFDRFPRLERNATYTSGKRLQWRHRQNKRQVPQAYGIKEFSEPTRWEEFPTKPAIRMRNDGISRGLDISTISENKWRNESIKAYGNAIVPQVAYEIFKVINQIEAGS